MFRNPVINVNSHTLGSLPLKNDNFNGLVDGEIAVNNNENDPFLSIKKYNTEGLKSDDFAKFIPEDKIDKKIETFENLQLITYSELVTLRNNSQLIPGRKYRIIDYSTTTSETDTVSAGHDFDIVVSAVSNSQLSEMADAIQRDGDTYFNNQKLESWKIWYCLDNDKTRYQWADTTNGKGVIYRMIDDKNNDCPYDFKNIMFKCPITNTNTSIYTGYYYTFTNINSAGEITDKSLSEANNNIIGVYTNNKSRLYYLPHNIFINVPTNEDDTAMCYSNILGKNCRNNFFNKGCICNILDTNCHDNFFDYNCRYTKMGLNCTWNVIGGGSYYNTFGINCSYNKFDKDCDSNFMMNYCRYNELGKECSYNLFNSHCFYNSFRIAKSSAAELRPYCKYNIFGQGCQYNVIWNSSTASSNYSIQGITITPNVIGTESAYNFINASTNKTFLYVAKATDGTIKIKNIGDLF